MNTVDALRDLYVRATKPEFERPVLLPGSDDTGVVGRATSELREALYALEIASKALAFYANPDNYKPVEFPTSVSEDAGELAKHALAVVTNA